MRAPWSGLGGGVRRAFLWTSHTRADSGRTDVPPEGSVPAQSNPAVRPVLGTPEATGE
jgi:hypothetical protein